MVVLPKPPSKGRGAPHQCPRFHQKNEADALILSELCHSYRRHHIILALVEATFSLVVRQRSVKVDGSVENRVKVVVYCSHFQPLRRRILEKNEEE